MTNERETHAPGTAEPELPARVPENGDAVTPDLPPLDPPAPDLWTAGESEDAGDAPRADPDHPADAEKPEPQEPTD